MAEFEHSTHELTGDEWRLIRLYRCLDEGEQDQLLVAACERLMETYSIDPLRKPCGSPEEALRKELSESVDDRVSRVWPGGWPDQHLVDLDNVGDPGFFLEVNLPDVAETILGTSGSDKATAESLSESYLTAAERYDIPLPTEFGATEDEMWEDLVSDFCGFLREWRERIIRTIEQQVHERADQDGGNERAS